MEALLPVLFLGLIVGAGLAFVFFAIAGVRSARPAARAREEALRVEKEARERVALEEAVERLRSVGHDPGNPGRE